MHPLILLPRQGHSYSDQIEVNGELHTALDCPCTSDTGSEPSTGTVSTIKSMLAGQRKVIRFYEYF